MKSLIFASIFLLISSSVHAQAKYSWPHIPGFDPSLPTTLTSQETFIGVVGLAALSFALEEFLLKKHDNTRFYTARVGMNNEYAWGLKNVWHQNIGLEYQVASWFSVSAAFNLQQWHDRTPQLEQKNKFGMGIGVMTHFRWYLFGKKRISPYLEYGTGFFNGFSRFPYNGTHRTFSHSTQLGIEYTLKNQHKIRLGYGNFHQSNNSWFGSNPGYDGNGFSISYAHQIIAE